MALHESQAPLHCGTKGPLYALGMTLGKRIKKARVRLGLTQAGLGAIMGVTDKAVSNWERDIDPPDGARFTDLKKALQVTYRWLLEGTGEPPELNSPGTILDGLSPEEEADAAAYIKFKRAQSGRAA